MITIMFPLLVLYFVCVLTITKNMAAFTVMLFRHEAEPTEKDAKKHLAT